MLEIYPIMQRRKPFGGVKMNKILEKIKNFFSRKSEKKEEPKPQQEEPKAQGKPKEQK